MRLANSAARRGLSYLRMASQLGRNPLRPFRWPSNASINSRRRPARSSGAAHQPVTGFLQNAGHFAIRGRYGDNRFAAGQVFEQLAGQAGRVGHGEQQKIGFRHVRQRLGLRQKAEGPDRRVPVLQARPLAFGNAAHETGLHVPAQISSGRLSSASR